MCGITMEENYSRLWKSQASTIIPQFLQSVEYIDFFQRKSEIIREFHS